MTEPRQRRRRIALAFAGLLMLLPTGMVCSVVQPTCQVRTEDRGPRASPERLRRDVARIVGSFGPRGHEQTLALDAVADFLASELQAAGGRVARQPYEGLDGLGYQNVIARFGPEDGPVLVVGAHYDAAAGLPGADDNASGTAGLLELARLLGEDPDLPMTVELVAYSTEEPPHFRTGQMGSAVHVQRALERGEEIHAMICLEMIGRFEDEPGSQTFPAPGLGLLYPTTGDYMVLVGRLGEGRLVRRAKRAFMSGTSLPVRSINAPPQIPGIDFSDHLNYWAEDIPALMVTDTAFFRNLDYHTEHDTPERLDYERMARTVDGVLAIVHALAAS